AALGPEATLAVAGFAGVADLDAATFAMADLARKSGVVAFPILGVVIAAATNTAAKAAIGAVVGGWAFAGPLALGSAAMVAAGALAGVLAG
ncbi:MAG: hypothetical protein HC900_10585, partial [Methylacidiphilales bacterium]|nr:hypothetical protein [Candidatus Methylacidiphilales bacterium]